MRRFVSIALVLILFAAQIASAAPLEDTPPFSLDCACAMLIEPKSGQIIFEKDADHKRPVASIVKMMTILLALEAMESGRVQADEIVTVSANASGMGGSQVLLNTGEQMPFSTLVMCVIVASANDAAVAVGEHMYGSVKLCVDRMNERARELGMENTNYVNCTGLPAQGQYTTARDVAVLSAELFRHEGYFAYSGIWLDELKHPDGRVTQLTNTNRLIRMYEGCDGGKTGSTDEAGYCVSATAKRGDMRLIAVVLGSSTGKIRFSTAQEILDHGFANYRVYPAAEKGAAVRGGMPVTGGAQDSVKLRLEQDMTLLVQKGAEDAIELVPNLPESLSAPVREGDIVGSVDIVRGGEVLGRVNVAAAQTVERQSFADGLQKVLEEWIYR